jgi:hypothetical protein
MKTRLGNHVESEDKGLRRKKIAGEAKEKDFPSDLAIGKGKRDSRSTEATLLVRVVSRDEPSRGTEK